LCYNAQTSESRVESFSISQFDRPQAFVLDDDPSIERASFYGTKSCQRGNNLSRTQITAAAVRKRDSKKFSKILRFMYSLVPSVSRIMETWTAVTGSGSGGTTLFTRRDDDGGVITPEEDSMECKEMLNEIFYLCRSQCWTALRRLVCVASSRNRPKCWKDSS
jgi:hypothetical protein